jgi:hypothetical protein
VERSSHFRDGGCHPTWCDDIRSGPIDVLHAMRAKLMFALAALAPIVLAGCGKGKY